MPRPNTLADQQRQDDLWTYIGKSTWARPFEGGVLLRTTAGNQHEAHAVSLQFIPSSVLPMTFAKTPKA